LGRISRRIAISAALASLASLGFAGTAAAEVDCGQTITQDTTLTHDVGPCSGDGIILGADNITLDLNGHTVTGDGVPIENHAGLRAAGRTGVTVENGTVSAFNAGALIDGGSGNTVRNVSTTANVGVSNLGEGISVTNSSSNTIQANNVSANGGFGGITLLGNSDGNVIDGNSVTGNQAPSTSAAQTIGIRLEQQTGADTDRNSIKNNRVIGNQLDGIAIFFGGDARGADGNEISYNLVELNGRDGIRLNKDRRNANRGFRAPQPNNTWVHHNSACENAINGSGIAVYTPRPTTIEDNQAGDGQPKKYPTASAGPCLPNSPVFSDLYDDSLTCANHTWARNSFTTAEPASCIQ
jgi:hypothetical protein